MGEGDGAERQAKVHSFKLRRPKRATDDEAEVLPAGPPLLKELAEPSRVRAVAAYIKQADERPLRDPSSDHLLLAHLNQVQPGVAAEQLRVVLDVVSEGRA